MRDNQLKVYIMVFSFYFGADKIPIQMENGRIISERPYFSIISRGLYMLPEWTTTRWVHIAHKLDHLITGIQTDDETILDSCYELDVMTVADTIRAAQIFLEDHAKDIALALLPRLKEDSAIDTVDSWFLKEGHTSSVWKITLTFIDGRQVSFVLNVARDKLANIELWNSSVLMEQLQTKKPNLPISNVLLKSKIALTNIRYEVVVVANQWIPDSKELHLVNDLESGEQYFFAIEEFVLDDAKKCTLTQLKGKSLSKSENGNIWLQIESFKKEAVLFESGTGKMIKPKFEINEGDVVWDGKRAVVVAIT